MHNEAEKIAECIKAKINEIGIDNIDCQKLEELGQWTDIVKDMVEYDYYKRIIEAMDEAEEMDELEGKLYGGRMGYRGRDSRGRFVHRSGRGRSAGYTPLWHMMPEMDDMYDNEYPEMYGNYRMGYTGGRIDGMNHRDSSEMRNMGASRRGETYDRYKDNRRHYTESQSPEHKKKMDESMKEYMEDAMDSMKEMWRDADPQLRQTMKADLTKMVQQLQ